MELLSKILSHELSGWDPAAMKMWLTFDHKGMDGVPLAEREKQPVFFEEIDAAILAPILNSLAEGIILTDVSQNIKVFNHAAVKLLGNQVLKFNRSEWHEKVQLFHPESRRIFPAGERPLDRALQGEAIDGLEVLLCTPAHPQGVYVEISARPVRDLQNQVYGAVALFKDITKRREAETELRHSKIRYETLSRMTNDFVWEWDVARHASYEPTAKNPFGYIDDDESNRENWWRKKIHPEDQNRIGHLHRLVMDGKTDSWRAEYRYQRPDGTYAHMLGQTKSILRNAEGKPTHIMGASIDISDHRAAEEKIAQLAAIVESSDDAIISTDLRGVILSWNKGAENLFGYSGQETIGKKASMLAEADQYEKLKAVGIKIASGESIQRHEITRVKKNGQKMQLSATLSPIRDSRGNVVGACAIMRDVTEVKTAQEQVKRLAENLTRSNEELKQFAYVASHDLREPLRTVASFVTLLERKYHNQLDERAVEYIRFAVKGVERMRNLINALLEYSRVEQSAPVLQPVDCQKLLERVIADLKIAIEESKAEIRLAVLPNVSADAVQLGQLFQNLISNAIKFRSEAAPKISINARTEAGQVIFSVEDQGIGIEPRFQERIFKIFQRLHGRDEYLGTGLGLAICKKIIERHGGRIWVQSRPGEGSTFFFCLPEAKS